MPTHLRLPRRGGWSRWVAIVTGAAVFIWLRLEDNDPFFAVVLGALVSVVWAALWLLGRWGGKMVAKRTVLVLAPALGAASGLGAALSTTLLMFFKNASHAHLYPDFPIEVMAAILQRAPLWFVAGALAGLGTACIGLALLARGAEDYSPERSSPAN